MLLLKSPDISLTGDSFFYENRGPEDADLSSFYSYSEISSSNVFQYKTHMNLPTLDVPFSYCFFSMSGAGFRHCPQTN